MKRVLLALAIFALALPATAHAGAGDNAPTHEAAGYGPFRPQYDCSPWQSVYNNGKKMWSERACAWHLGTHIRTGRIVHFLESVTLGGLGGIWSDEERTASGKVVAYATHSRTTGPLHTGDIRTDWVDYTGGPGANVCVRTNLGGFLWSPWQKGYDNNAHC